MADGHSDDGDGRFGTFRRGRWSEDSSMDRSSSRKKIEVFDLESCRDSEARPMGRGTVNVNMKEVDQKSWIVKQQMLDEENEGIVASQ